MSWVRNQFSYYRCYECLKIILQSYPDLFIWQLVSSAMWHLLWARTVLCLLFP